MRQPRGSRHESDATTPLYLDVFIAWELHMLYSEYIRRTTPTERLLYQLFLGLKSFKDRQTQEAMQQEATITREMSAPQGPPVRR